MPSRQIEDLHPDLQIIAKEFVRRCATEAPNVKIICTWRSNYEQDELYKQGRTKPGAIVTRAKAGQSAHNFMINGKPAAKAFDIAVLINNKYAPDNHKEWDIAGRIGTELGLNWYGREGAPFKEKPHFQLKG
jgi:peptidoglycan L-alanyl-D-glutamate endopeptidase CwlK